MRIHTITVSGRFATCDDLKLVQGTSGVDAVRLELDSEWGGLEVFVAFDNAGEKRTPARNPDGTYTVPWECLVRAGSLRCS